MYEAEDQAAAHAALAPAAKRGAHAVIELQRPQPGASTKARLAPVGVFLATLGFLLLTHGGHFYAADSLIVHLTATKLVEEQTLELGDVWGTVQGADGKRYGRYGLGLSLLQAPLAWLGKQIDLRTPTRFASSPERTSASTTPRASRSSSRRCSDRCAARSPRRCCG